MNMKAREASWEGQELPRFPFPMLSLDVFLPAGLRVSAPNLSQPNSLCSVTEVLLYCGAAQR